MPDHSKNVLRELKQEAAACRAQIDDLSALPHAHQAGAVCDAISVLCEHRTDLSVVPGLCDTLHWIVHSFYWRHPQKRVRRALKDIRCRCCEVQNLGRLLAQGA